MPLSLPAPSATLGGFEILRFGLNTDPDTHVSFPFHGTVLRRNDEGGIDRLDALWTLRGVFMEHMVDDPEMNITPPTLPLGALIDAAHDLRERRRELADEDKKLNKQFTALQARILEQFTLQGTDMARGHKASASITAKVIPAVDNWDQFYAFIQQNNAFHLLEKRAASNAFREMHNAGLEVPGVTPFTKTDLNLRSI